MFLSASFCSDPGKTLPESLDYNVFWLQTVSGEVDSKTGIPPPLLCLQIKDFLNGPGGNRAHTHTLLYTHAKKVGFNKRGAGFSGFFLHWSGTFGWLLSLNI